MNALAEARAFLYYRAKPSYRTQGVVICRVRMYDED